MSYSSREGLVHPVPSLITSDDLQRNVLQLLDLQPLHKADTKSGVPSPTAGCCDLPGVTRIPWGCQGSGLQDPHSHSGKMAPPTGEAGTSLDLYVVRCSQQFS